MRLLLALFLLLPFGLNAATTFTEFYCDSTVGTNINSGSTTNAAATYTSVNGNFNGTDTFTPTDGSTPASTVSVGDWAAVYIDGATNLVQSGSGGYIVRVLSVAAGANGAITVSTSAFAGTAPSSSATGRSIKVGGAWNGPYGTIGFPFGFLATTATNAPNVFPRCNFKNTAQYNVTAAMTHGNAGPIRFQGMTLTPDDGGKATIDGGNPSASYTILAASGANCDYVDFIIQRNGTASGTGDGIDNTAAENYFYRIVFREIYRAGLRLSAASRALELEFYNCVKGNAASYGSLYLNGDNGIVMRCVFHDNTGANVSGIQAGYPYSILNCVFFGNTRGLTVSATGGSSIIGCDFYENVTYGVDFSATVSAAVIENCNFIKNGTFGISSSGTSLRNGGIYNCGFGSGTMTNSSGGIAANASSLSVSSTITYAADQSPWIDPENGDFRINLTAAKAAGRGSFTQAIVNSPTNTVAFPDIGAAQSASTNAAAAGGTTAHTFAQ